MSILNATMMPERNAAFARAFVVAHPRSQGSARVLGTNRDGQGTGGCRGKAAGPSLQR